MKRRKITAAMRVRIFDAAEGACCICGLAIDPRKQRWIVEHVKPLWLGGSDDADNMAPAHQQCAVDKTAAEAAQRAKTVRVRARHLGIRRRRRPLPGGRNSPWKKKISGEVVRRAK